MDNQGSKSVAARMPAARKILHWQVINQFSVVLFAQWGNLIFLFLTNIAKIANISLITLNTSSLTKSINVAIAHGKNKTCFPSWAQISTEQQLKST